MNDFRSGKVNVLIATCVGEEGIDVGEIDFIICFDISTKNPTRFVQRIGRTGRRREGSVLMLVTEGKEQKTLKQVLSTKDTTNKQIMHSTEISNCLYKSPRLIPTEFNPTCLEVYIKNNTQKNEQFQPDVNVPEHNERFSTDNEAISKKQPTKLANKNVKSKKLLPSSLAQDVRNFFKPIHKEIPNTMNNSVDYDFSMVEEQPEPTSSILDTSAIFRHKKITENLENLKKLKIKLFGNNFAAIPTLTKIPNITTVVNQKSTPKSLKRYTLENNLGFLKSNFIASERNKENSEDDVIIVDESSLNSNTLCDIFDGHQNIIKHLNNFKSKNDMQILQTFNQIFENLNIPNDIPLKILQKDFDQTDIIVTSEDLHLSSNTDTEPILDFNTQLPHYIEVESKYASQIASPSFSINKKFTSSTPSRIKTPIKSPKLTPTKTKSSLPTKQFIDIKPLPPKESPIKKAFERAIEIQKSKLIPADRSRKEVYTFFGLNDVSDLFADDSDSDPEQVTSPNDKHEIANVENQPKFPIFDNELKDKNSYQKCEIENPVIVLTNEETKPDNKLNNIENPELKQPEVNANNSDHTQLSIAAILDFVNGEENEENNNISSISANKSVKNFNIGTVEELLAFDDEDMFQSDEDSDDVILPSQAPSRQMSSISIKPKTTIFPRSTTSVIPTTSVRTSFSRFPSDDDLFNIAEIILSSGENNSSLKENEQPAHLNASSKNISKTNSCKSPVSTRVNIARLGELNKIRSKQTHNIAKNEISQNTGIPSKVISRTPSPEPKKIEELKSPSIFGFRSAIRAYNSSVIANESSIIGRVRPAKAKKRVIYDKSEDEDSDVPGKLKRPCHNSSSDDDDDFAPSRKV